MNTKKVVIAMDSPRKKGNSATLAYRVAEGAKAECERGKKSSYNVDNSVSRLIEWLRNLS